MLREGEVSPQVTIVITTSELGRRKLFLRELCIKFEILNRSAKAALGVLRLLKFFYFLLHRESLQTICRSPGTEQHLNCGTRFRGDNYDKWNWNLQQPRLLFKWPRTCIARNKNGISAGSKWKSVRIRILHFLRPISVECRWIACGNGNAPFFFLEEFYLARKSFSLIANLFVFLSFKKSPNLRFTHRRHVTKLTIVD